MNPPPIALLVMTDGRDYTLHRTIESARVQLRGNVVERWIHDDSGDGRHAAELATRYRDFEVIAAPTRSGFGGAIRRAWQHLHAVTGAAYVFHLEDDFVFPRPIELAALATILDLRPHVAQVALRRQPWNAEERAAGGIVEQHPGDFEDHCSPVHDLEWLEHRRFFTTNPSLFRRELLSREWPDGANSEGRFSIELFSEDPANRSAYFGARDSGEWCEHIGLERVGTGY